MFDPASLQADLAWLFASPPLLRASPGIVPANAALGAAWLQALPPLVLDPAPWSARQPFRLGAYAEYLMASGLAALPAHRLLAQQLTVWENGRTLGEYDYLLAGVAGRLLHIELAVKIYLMLPAALGCLAVGPGLRDALLLKQHVLRRQLALASTPAGQAALPDGYDQVEPVAWIRGWIFYPATEVVAPDAALAPGHLRGWWQWLGLALPEQQADSRWRILPRQYWLAARPLREEEVCRRSELEQSLAQRFALNQMPQMVAEYASADDGGVELARGFVVPPSWPQADALNGLMAKLNKHRAGHAG